METWNDSQRTDVFTLNEDPVSANMNNSSDVPSLNTNDEVVDMGADFDFRLCAGNSLRIFASQL